MKRSLGQRNFIAFAFKRWYDENTYIFYRKQTYDHIVVRQEVL